MRSYLVRYYDVLVARVFEAEREEDGKDWHYFNVDFFRLPSIFSEGANVPNHEPIVWKTKDSGFFENPDNFQTEFFFDYCLFVDHLVRYRSSVGFKNFLRNSSSLRNIQAFPDDILEKV